MDSGPKFDDGCPDIDGVSNSQECYHDEGSTSEAKNVAQLGPCVHLNSREWLITDDPPCPSDRWCGDSASESSGVMLRSCLQPVMHRGVKSKSVNFDNTVDVFGFDPASSADALPEEWWTDAVESLVPTAQRAISKVQVGADAPLDTYLDFWTEWGRLWQPVQKIIDSNGPIQPRGGCIGRFDDSPVGQFEHGGSWKEQRNEGGHAVGLQDPRLVDPRAFVPEVPEDHDSDDDLGVSFFRWIDVIRLTDLHPYRHEGSIPFITYGLRRQHLGRRDFSSPDLLPGRIKELVWNLWQDEVGQFEQVVIHFIRPQPVREVGADGVIILLIEILCDDIPPGTSPALAVTCDTSHRLMDSPKALYVERAVDEPLLMPHFGLSYLCAPRGFRQCTFTVASALIGAYYVPVPEGALIKLIISSKLRIFAQSFQWFPDLERFASVVREQVRSGIQDHAMILHGKDASPKRLGFRIGQLLAPPQLRVSIQQLCGHEIKACYPVDHDAINAMLGGTSTAFHALVYLHEQPLDHAFLVVTGRDRLHQDVHSRRVVVCLRDSFGDLEALHSHLHGSDSLSSDEAFIFLHDGRPIHDLHAIPFGSVVLHSVVHAPEGDVSVEEADATLESEDLTDDEIPSEDDLSLIQIKAKRRHIKLLQAGHPSVDVVVQHDDEDLERCAIMTQLPSRFVEAREWADRCQVRSATGLCVAELLMDPYRHDGMCAVIADCMWTGVGCEPVYGVVVIRVASSCAKQDVIHALSRQLGCIETHIEQLWVHGALWDEDTPRVVDNGDVCQVQINAGECGLPCPRGNAVIEYSWGEAKLFTFVSEVDGTHRRFDVVACDEDQACAQIEGVFDDPIQLTLVRWDPSHLEPCRSLFLVSKRNQASSAWPALFVLRSPDGQQLWQVCHLDPGHLLQAVHHRFPKARSFPLLGDGRVLSLDDTMEKPGMCIWCDTVDGGDRGLAFSFTDGMQKLLRWMSSPTEPDVSAVGTSGGEGGAAPCLLRPMLLPGVRDILRSVVTGVVVPITPDNSDLCSDRHDRPVASGASLAIQKIRNQRSWFAQEASSPKVQISLEASLCDCFPVDEAAGVKIQVHHPGWSAGNESCNCEFGPIPDGICVHPATAIALEKCKPCVDVAQFQLFIDGSACTTAAGWSVVVLAVGSQGETQLVGCLCGAVCTNEALPEWFGASSATNIDAELQAMVVAQLVALSMVSTAPVVIRPDLQFSHDLADRRVGARKDDVLAAMLASLGSLMPTGVTVQEVCGHVGNPWNELADAIAKAKVVLVALSPFRQLGS